MTPCLGTLARIVKLYLHQERCRGVVRNARTGDLAFFASLHNQFHTNTLYKKTHNLKKRHNSCLTGNQCNSAEASQNLKLVIYRVARKPHEYATVVANRVGKCQIFYTDQYQQTRFYPDKSA